MGDAAWGSWDALASPTKYGKPPQHPGSLQSPVPSWERTFCTSVCSIHWGRICAAKASLSAYKNIAEWDDAAAFEAFQNAKARYWAYTNNYHCDIPLPDPQMYIDKVNYNAVIDPKLVEDLEELQPPPLSDCKKEGSNGWDSLIIENKQTPATGWGNACDGSLAERHSVSWDKFIDQQRVSPGWGDSENHISRNADSSDAWNFHGGWGDVTVRDCSWGSGGNNNSGNNRGDHWWSQHGNNVNNEQANRNSKKRTRGHYESRVSRSRQADNWQMNGSNWDGRKERNMQDYRYEKTMRGGQPMSLRQSKSRRTCGPFNNQRNLLMYHEMYASVKRCSVASLSTEG